MILKQFVNLSLILVFAYFTQAQQEYNNCNNALVLCPGTPSLGITNIDANKTFCGGCEDDFNFCFTASNTIWMTFETNDLGGTVNVNFSNLIFELNPNQGTQIQATILRALVPCDAATFTAVGNCVFDASTNFTLSAADLLPNSTYYIVVSGALNNGTSQAAEATFDVLLSGEAVNRLPVNLYLYVESDEVCSGDVVFMVASFENCNEPSTFFWYIDGELVAQTEGPTFQTSALQHGQGVSVRSSCFTYCTLERISEPRIFQVETVLVNAGTDLYINQGESVQLNGSTPEETYIWSPSFGISNPTILNPLVNPSETTTYYLTASSENCSASDGVTVFVNKSLEITNTFTPNRDGNNDTWYIPGLTLFPNCLVEIYTRWGQKIYQSTGYSQEKAWDGTKNGKELESGTYFYNINLRDGSDTVLKGYVNLIR
jgi:gliding motility-associated-like protein